MKPEATRLTEAQRCEIQLIEIFVEYESATDFKGFEALYNVVLDIDDQLFAPMFKRKLDKCMMNCDNCVRCSNETLTNIH